MFEDVKDVKVENVNQDAIDLAFQSLLLNSILNEAFDKRDTQKITEYLNSLSGMVHKFYNNHKIVGIDNQKEYLKVLAMAALSIRVGLNVLGIEAKEVM